MAITSDMSYWSIPLRLVNNKGCLFSVGFNISPALPGSWNHSCRPDDLFPDMGFSGHLPPDWLFQSPVLIEDIPEKATVFSWLHFHVAF